MSMFEDFAADHIGDDEELRSQIARQAAAGIWHTKSGQHLDIKTMSDTHIQNCINMLKSNDKTDTYIAWIDAFEKELERRANRPLEERVAELEARLEKVEQCLNLQEKRANMISDYISDYRNY